MQTQGSLARNSLASLLQDMQSQRATGTLEVTSPDARCSLHLLFGHIFHAAGDSGRGAEAVIAALSWGEGEFRFDPRATLPHDETITVSTGDLIAEADRRRPRPPRPADTWRPPVTPPVASPVTPPAVLPAALPVTPPMVLPTAAATPRRLYPLPSGIPLCAGLSSDLVDLDRLMRTLESDRLTGYLRLQTRDFTGVLLLAQGRILEAWCGPEAPLLGGDALQQLRRRMDAGDGRLMIVELSAEAVVALTQLLIAPPLATGLLGRFVDFHQLLQYLGEERFDGSVTVESGAETGIVLLFQGALVGAYTASEPDLNPSPLPIGRLATHHPAHIEVRGRTP
ncbi:MAG: hypothetical protein QOE72_1626 [Chloroflexota bacterium]|jgi:hypothetical protein|nr:hypothetical protein [Chloroflexota bacterium]